MFIALAKFFREKQDLHVYIGEDANENKFSLASSPIYTYWARKATSAM